MRVVRESEDLKRGESLALLLRRVHLLELFTRTENLLL
jgi:hypothetical protein